MKDVGRRSITYRSWSPPEDARLAELYKTKPITEISEIMGRSTSSIHNRVQKLGLRRTDEYKAITGSGRFGSGKKPWNAGLKGWQAGGRSKETQFKKGDKPSNTWRPIGAERISKDGILYRKVADTGVKKEDWRAVQVVIWEEHNGPLPDGHIVIFKDGDRENFDPDNLLAMTRADNMRRNSIDRYGSEYRSAALQLSWLKRKLNKLEKEHENTD